MFFSIKIDVYTIMTLKVIKHFWKKLFWENVFRKVKIGIKGECVSGKEIPS